MHVQSSEIGVDLTANSETNSHRENTARKTRDLIALVFVAILGTLGLGPSADAQSLRTDEIAFARSKVYPALVNISVLSQGFMGGRTERLPSAGSGTIVSPAGHVVTNYHVIENALRITCTLPDGESLRADIVGQDPETDIGVLQLRLSERSNPSAPLPFATLGDSSTLEVGDHVLAAGNPLALSSSLTFGIISNRERVFTNFLGTEIENLSIGAQRTGMFTQWLQHDALILPGNSGGPLLDLRGEIVGVNTRGGSGVAFASPSNLVKKVLSQILTHGEVRRGWLGVSLLPVGKLDRDQGALISSVAKDSPASKAGLLPGDILLAIDEEPMRCRFIEQVPTAYGMIADGAPGSVIRLKYERDQATHEAEITLERMAPFAGLEAELRDVGVTLMNVTRPMATFRRLKSEHGVVVTGIRPGQAAEKARPRIQPGDVITALDNQPIKTIADFEKLLEKRGDPEAVAVTLTRSREEIITVIPFEEDSEKNQGKTLPNAWVGLKTQVLSHQVAKALGMEGTRGFRITEVFPGTEAARAKVQVGDILVAFDGETLDAYREQDASDLDRLIEEYPVGDTVDIEILRGGEKKTLSLTLEDSPREQQDAEKGKDDFLEVSVRELVFMDRVLRELEDDLNGVIVTECTSGGWAAMSGLRAGDLLISANDKATTSPNEFEKALAEIQEQKPKRLTLFVKRGVGTHFIFIEPDWQ